MLYAAIAIGAVAWIGGFVGTFHRTYVPKNKLWGYTLLFFGWPFVLLYMQGRE